MKKDGIDKKLISEAKTSAFSVVEKHKKSFRDSDVLGIEYTVTLGDGSKKKTIITKDIIKSAKQYVKSNDGLICQLTVNEAISKITRGEISLDTINDRSLLRDKNMRTTALIMELDMAQIRAELVEILGKGDFELSEK